ncbi:MAG: hypothetical protein ACHQNV_05285 [Vicinamibacteria bacterium]
MIRLGVVVALAALAYTVLQAVFGGLLLSSAPALPGNATGLFLAANLLSATTVVVLAARIASRGWHRALVLFFVLWGIQANNLVEAVFFSLDIPRAMLRLLFLDALCVSLVFAFVVDRLAPVPAVAGPSEPASRTTGSWLARIAACDIGYVVAYMTAGLLVWPFVQGFYLARPMPDPRAVPVMAMFRGLVFTGIVGLLVRQLAVRRMAVGLLVGATLSVIGGVVPLMVPNPYMPDAIRFPHMIEVGVSNFLWGLGAALLLSPGAGSPALSKAHAA